MKGGLVRLREAIEIHETIMDLREDIEEWEQSSCDADAPFEATDDLWRLIQLLSKDLPQQTKREIDRFIAAYKRIHNMLPDTSGKE
jgi:hypothetical protein